MRVSEPSTGGGGSLLDALRVCARGARARSRLRSQCAMRHASLAALAARRAFIAERVRT